MLLRSARGGDREALDRLFARYLPLLRRWARGRLPLWARSALDTDDLVQDTLLQTLRRLEEFDHRREGALQAYLRQALHNRILEEIRRASRRPKASDTPADCVDQAPSPLEQVVGQEGLRRYESSLRHLKDHEREAIVLRVELGYSYQEIAAAMGKRSADAARMNVGRALVRLAKEMGRGR